MSTNRKPANCSRCATFVSVGQGSLWWEFDDDDERKIWRVSCLDEAACTARVEEAKAQFQARYEAGQRRLAALKALSELFEAGERPEGMNEPRGERVSLVRLHRWAVIGASEIWLCLHNGNDGDDWSHNNMPGAIGWRLPYSDELAARVRGLGVEL